MTEASGGPEQARSGLDVDTLLLAHRAGNDLTSLRLAERAGADAVEADVHLHRGRLELRHLKRLGPLPLHWDRWYLARPVRPALVLEDLLATAAPGTSLMLDLKGVDRRLAPSLARALERATGGQRVLVCSRTWSLLDALPRDLGVRRVYSAGSSRQLAALARRVGRTQADGVSVHARLLTPAWGRSLSGVVPRVMAWAVDTIGTLDGLAAGGVNGFILDDLALLRAASVARPGRVA